MITQNGIIETSKTKSIKSECHNHGTLVLLDKKRGKNLMCGIYLNCFIFLLKNVFDFNTFPYIISFLHPSGQVNFLDLNH